MTGATAPSSPAAAESAEVFDLLRRLVSLLLAWSYEGTMRSEEIIRSVAMRYGAEVEVTMLADSAVFTIGERTASCARAPTVPPLDQVSDLKRLLLEIEDGAVSPREASRRLDAIQHRPPLFSKIWQVVGLGLFATGFGISIQATGQEIVASAILGTLVGLLAVTSQGRPRFALVVPFVASVVVSTLVLFATSTAGSTAARSS